MSFKAPETLYIEGKEDDDYEIQIKNKSLIK